MPPASERHPVRRWFAWAHLMVVAWLAVAQLGALGSWASAWLSPRVGAAPMAQQVRPEPVAVVPVRRLAKPQSGVTPEAQHLAPSKAPRAVSAERPSRPPCVRCAARGS
ncbi:MAG: hypothetical protein KF915_20775 [Polyangiaceae bacterium]|nr:hypothetical protein [Polyangiaceae bacterium]